MASNIKKVDEFEAIWKEGIVTYPRYYPCIFLEGQRKASKTSVRIAIVSTKIRTKNFLNTNLDRYRYANPLVLYFV
jgi:hypothetical protein